MSVRLQLILATKGMKKKSYPPIIDLDQDSSRELSVVFEDQYSCEVFTRFFAYQHIFRKCEGNFADFVCGTMSPLLRDVKEEINNQGRSQTSEQDKASFERRRSKARIAWNFSSQTESILGQNQDEAIASSCLMLATALIISNTFILYYLRIQFHLLRMPKVGRLQRVVFLVSSSS